MNLEETDFPGIEARLVEVQRLPGAAHTNFFRQSLTGSRYWAASGERSFVFVTDDLDFLRLYFLTKDASDLKNLLSAINLPRTTVTALVARRFDPHVDDAFLANGHRHHALFRRMTTRALRVARTNSHLEFAGRDDIDEVLHRLRTDFDPYTSHPPSRAMLEYYVSNQWVLVIRKNGRICGYIVFQLVGNQVNYNFLFNAGADPGEFLFLQNNFFGLLDQLGIRAGFLWVDETNTRVLKMNEVSGWKLDGLMTRYLITQPAS